MAVFTQLNGAEKYIDDANWGEDFCAAKLEPIDFLEWLIQCYRNGVRFMATNPNRQMQVSGQSIDTLEIEKYLELASIQDNLVAGALP